MESQWNEIVPAYAKDLQCITTKHTGFDLPRKIWFCANRVRTGHGRCRDTMYKWGKAPSENCYCCSESKVAAGSCSAPVPALPWLEMDDVLAARLNAGGIRSGGSRAGGGVPISPREHIGYSTESIEILPFGRTSHFQKLPILARGVEVALGIDIGAVGADAVEDGSADAGTKY
nr:unnamed protein product [Callosobruchus chinensis]